MPSTLVSQFKDRFGAQPRVFRAPGRVNLIGEHTDHNFGLALPGAIDRYCTVALTPSNTPGITAVALDVGEEAQIAAASPAQNGWRAFVAGAAHCAGFSGGARVMFSSTVPVGGGVSSSAALAVALVQAFSYAAGAPLAGLALAKSAQRVERAFVGVPCGLMDQWASACGCAGQVLLMDFQSEAATLSMMPAQARVLVLDSGAHHALGDGGYARVFQECRDAALALGAPSLRAAEAAELSRLPPNLRDRALYVRQENVRVRTMAAALEQGDLIAAGALMNEGHAGIRDLFKITVPETDALQALAAATPGVFGARQMGGGFGGSVVALVDAEKAETALAAITSATGQSGFIAAFVDGAAEIMP